MRIWNAEVIMSKGFVFQIDHRAAGREIISGGATVCKRNESAGPGYRPPATVSRALRTEKWSSPENTRFRVRPSSLIHLVGKLAVSPGPTSHRSVKNTV